MNTDKKNMPADTFRNGVSKGKEKARANVVLGITFSASIYDQIVAMGEQMGLKDQEVVRLAVAKLVSQF